MYSLVKFPKLIHRFKNIIVTGNDPATDLRGSGMLGLLQLLYMVSDPRLIPLTRDIYKLSRHDEQVCRSSLSAKTINNKLKLAEYVFW